MTDPTKKDKDSPPLEINADEKTKEDAAKKKQPDEDAAKKKAEYKLQEDLAKHLIQPVYMRTQAGLQFMKAKPDLGRNGKVIYIPPSSMNLWKFSYT